MRKQPLKNPKNKTPSYLTKYKERLQQWTEHCKHVKQLNKRVKNWILSHMQQMKVDNRWFGLTGIANFVTSAAGPFGRTGTMKIHEWHVFGGTDAGKYCMAGILPQAEYVVFAKLMECLQDVLQHRIDVSVFREEEIKMIETMCELERSLPPTEMSMMLQMLLNIRFQILRFNEETQTLSGRGSARDVWMYMFERFLSTLTRKIHNRSSPESNLMDMHMIDIAVQHVSSVYAEDMKESFDGPVGFQLFRNITMNNDLLTATPDMEIGLPTLRVRAPYILQANLSSTEHDEILALLDVTELDSKIWLITTAVKYIILRTTTVQDQRRNLGPFAITSAGFYGGDDMVGRIQSFVVVDAIINGHPVQRSVVLVDLYRRQYDVETRLYFIDVNTKQRKFVTFDYLGTLTVVFRPMSVVASHSQLKTHYFVFPTKTGLNRRTWLS